MLKMKLPVKPEEGMLETAEDKLEETYECNLHFPDAVCQPPCSPPDSPDLVHRLQGRGAGFAAPLITKEAVYEWFGLMLSPAQRIEFVCGLLDLCNPLELRFLGSCLEDLARKDYHYLRDSEVRANGLSDIGQLNDVTDPEVRSKLLVYLALLRSENRECAGLLYRVLTHVDTIVKNYGLPTLPTRHGATEAEVVPGSGTGCQVGNGAGVGLEDELLLLFTMASLHPAFTFRQRVALRDQLEELKKLIYGYNSQVLSCPCTECEPCCESNLYRRTAGPHDGLMATSHRPQREAVHIEKITLKSVSRKRADKHLEYTFEVTWSNFSVNSVTKTHQELQKFLLNLPKEFSAEPFNKTILRALNQGLQKREERRHSDLDPLRQLLLTAPQAFLRSQEVCNFFLSKSADFGCIHNNPHISVHLKKQVGNCPSAKIVGVKCHALDEVNNVAHSEQNGVADRRKRSSTLKHHTENSMTHGGQHITEEWNLPLENKKKTLPPVDKEKMKVERRPNGFEVSTMSQIPTRTEKDSDSNSEDSVNLEKKMEFSSCRSMNVTSRPTAQVAPVLNDNGTYPEDPLNTSKFQHTALKSTPHCFLQNGAQKTEPDGALSVTVDGKPSGMFMTAPAVVSPITESLSVGVGTASASESEKQTGLISSPLAIPAPFLAQSVQARCSHHQGQNLKLVTSPSNSDGCATPGPQPSAGNINHGSSNTAFIPVQSGNIPGSPIISSDPIPKAVASNAFGLSSIVPQAEGNTGTGMVPQSNNLKGILSPPGLPVTPLASYALPGALLSSSVLPTQGTTILNSAAATPPPPPAAACVGQVQSGVPPAVPTHTPGPAPSPSPALTHSTAPSESTSYINCVANSGTNRTVLPQQPVGTGACNSCGRGCSCGTSRGGEMNFYYPAPQGQQYRLQVFPFPPICNSSYLNQAHQSNGTQLPFFLPQTPYANGLIPDPVLGSQANYGIQQMAGFPRFYPVYQAPVIVPSANGPVPKKNGTISCCNCGASGHYSPDCKQPPMEASQQVTFRLKCAPLPPTNTLDSAD